MVFHAAKAPGKKLPSRLPSCRMTTWSGKCVWMLSCLAINVLVFFISVSAYLHFRFVIANLTNYSIQISKKTSWPSLGKPNLPLLKCQIFEGHVLGVVRLCSSLAWAMNVKRLWNHHTLKQHHELGGIRSPEIKQIPNHAIFGSFYQTFFSFYLDVFLRTCDLCLVGG